MNARHSRHSLIDALYEKGASFEGEWAFQGMAGAEWAWAERKDQKDLDIWVRNEETAAQLAEVLQEWGGVRISAAPRPPRILHHTWWLGLAEGPAVVDITVGDLGAGPVSVVPADRIRAVAGRLTGEAGVFDLIGRKLLAGQIPPAERIGAGEEAYLALTEAERRLTGWPTTLRRATHSVLGGDRRGRHARYCRLAMVGWTLRRPAAAWGNRHEILGRRKSPVSGLAARGVVVAFIGADGSGKSTMLEAAASSLENFGAKPIRLYLGMIRGNLVGVEALRRGAHKLLASRPRTPVVEETPGKPGRSGGSGERVLRWAAAWLYAVDLAWRIARARRHARRGHLVLCDRWAYDLALEPAAGHPAGRWLGRRHPDVVVFCDGDPAVMWERKPETSLETTTRRQDHYRECAERAAAAGRATVTVDTVTGGGVEGEAARIVAAVVAASHRVGWEEGL